MGDQDVDSDISDSQMSDLGDTLADKGATTPQLEGTPTPINALRWKLSQPSCLGTPKDATEERIDYQTSAYSDTDLLTFNSCHMLSLIFINVEKVGLMILFLTCKVLLVKFETIS